MPYCNLIMGNIWSANTLLGIPMDETLLAQNNQQAYLQHATHTAHAIMQQFPNCKTVANTFRFDAGSGIQYYASLNTAAEQWVSSTMQTATVVDKVGSGDCFMAGLIHGSLAGYSGQEIIQYAATAAFAKLQEKGDTTSNTSATIHQLMQQHG
jgi:2-dehydro-3-deoxygluconokinase